MTSKDHTQEMDDAAATNQAHESTTSENIDTEDAQNGEINEKEDINTDETAEESDVLAELQGKYDVLNDKFLRLYSEFENYRRRTSKEKRDAVLNGGSEIAKDLLPVLDDFDRAIASNENSDNADALKEGFILIQGKLKRVLEAKGLKEMDSMAKPFDTEYHDAITKIPAPSEELKGKVIDVAEKGYFYNDKILRHAKVVVGS